MSGRARMLREFGRRLCWSESGRIESRTFIFVVFALILATVALFNGAFDCGMVGISTHFC